MPRATLCGEAVTGAEAADTVFCANISVIPTTLRIPRTRINTSPRYFSSSPSVQSPKTFVVSKDFINLLAKKNKAITSNTMGLPAGVDTICKGLPHARLMFSISPKNKSAVKGSADTPTTDAYAPARFLIEGPINIWDKE